MVSDFDPLRVVYLFAGLGQSIIYSYSFEIFWMNAYCFSAVVRIFSS
jgi:hypothetical protein